MKILLIHPYCTEERLTDDDISVVPIGLFYIGAMLREEGHDVKILNWYCINRTPEEIPSTISKEKPDIMGFSILQANRWGGIEIARVAKKLDPRIKIVFGGVCATYLWRHFLTNFPEIDYVVLGEGEITFLNLVESLWSNDSGSTGKIRGIAFRQRGKPIKNTAPEPVESIDELPNPARFFTYRHVVSSRGCPWNCTFCGSPGYWGRKVRFHSPRYFVDQLEMLRNRGVNLFFVSDDTFTLREQRVIEICREIIERRLEITWVAISRVNLVTERMLSWMRKAGCIQISYGVESGSEKIRKIFNKQIKREEIRKAFRLTTRYGILPRAYFIYGAPGENDKTIQESIELIREIRPLSIIFYILALFPGTTLYTEFKKKFGISDDIWLNRMEDIMYFETDRNLTEDMVLNFGKRLREAFYEALPGFVESIRLVDDSEFDRLNSDFYSRLGMTFSHGDYSGIAAIKNRDEIAGRLFARAIHCHPDHRAYLGKGIIHQKKGEFDRSIELLKEGLRYFPESKPLNICLAVSYMNTGRFDQALSRLLPIKDDPEAASYIEACRRALEDAE